MFKLLRNKKGFTLIELMIVVAIIAILAAIAIPNFLNYRYKARTAEAKSNIGSINTLEEAYAAETDNYVTAAAYPDASSDVWDGNATSWASGQYIEAIGFRPKGKVYYSYSVGTTAPGSNSLTAGSDGIDTVLADSAVDIYIMASGNLDDDASTTFGSSTAGQFYASDEDRSVVDNNFGEF